MRLRSLSSTTSTCTPASRDPEVLLGVSAPEPSRLRPATTSLTALNRSEGSTGFARMRATYSTCGCAATTSVLNPEINSVGGNWEGETWSASVFNAVSASLSPSCQSSSSTSGGDPAAIRAAVRSITSLADATSSVCQPSDVANDTIALRWFSSSSAISTSKSVMPWRSAIKLRSPGIGKVKSTQNSLPSPSVLRTPADPPIISANRRTIDSPKPVPPKRRLVELSAWVKAVNNRCWTSSVMPTPVSDTLSRRVAASGVRSVLVS